MYALYMRAVQIRKSSTPPRMRSTAVTFKARILLVNTWLCTVLLDCLTLFRNRGVCERGYCQSAIARQIQRAALLQWSLQSEVMDQESPTANPPTFSDDMSTAEVSAWLKSQGIPEQYCKAFEGTFLARKWSALLAQTGTSFDVRWSLVAQAVPENELFLSKMSIFRNRYWPRVNFQIFNTKYIVWAEDLRKIKDSINLTQVRRNPRNEWRC